MKYVVVNTHVDPPGACWLGPIENVKDQEDLKLGVSCATRFPTDAAFHMLPEMPKKKKLVDRHSNTSRCLVVSERVKDALESIPGALFKNEVLPVKIINHKGREEDARYFIIHQIEHPACLDETASAGVRFTFGTKRFQFLQKMVLDEAKIEPERMLFRAGMFPSIPIIRRDLAEKLKELSFVGLEFAEIEGFKFLGC